MKSLQFELKIDLWSPQKIAGAFTFLIILTQIIVITSKTEPSKFKIISETYNLTAPYPIKLRFEIETLNRLNQFLITTVHFKSDLPIGMVVSPTINVTTYGSDTSNKISTRRSADLEIECQANGNCSTIQIDHQIYLKYNKYILDFEINDDSGFFLFDTLYLNFYTKHPNSSYFYIYTKFSCLSFLIGWIFFLLKKFRGIPWSGFTYEQQSIFSVLFLSIVALNPIYPLIFITGTYFVFALNQYLLITFFCIILIFFSCIISSYRVPKGSRTFVKFYLPKLILIFSLWLFLLLDKSRQPQIELYESQKESSKAFFYSYGIIYLIALTWSWGKTRRGLKQKRYLKRFTFFVVTSIPILFLFWLTLAKHIIYNNYDANDRANMEWLVITIYTTYLSYGWLYHKPHELFEYFSSEKFKHGSDNFEFVLDEENEPRKVLARVQKKEKDLGEVDFENQNMNEKFFDSNTFSLKTEDDLDQKSDCNLEGDNIN